MRGNSAYLRPILLALSAGLLGCGCGSGSRSETAGPDAGGLVDPGDGGTGGGAGGDTGDSGVTGDGGPDGGEPTDAMAPTDAGLQGRIDEAIRSIESDTCFAQDDSSQCDWADYEVGLAEFDMARSTGESILVIDEFVPGFFPELVRYRNRIRGFYQVQGDSIEAQVLSVHLPKRLGDVLVSFAGPEFIPADALTSIAVAMRPVYAKLNLLYYGHGGVIFTHLVELVPEQPLVLLDLTHLLDIPPVICEGIDDGTLAAATAHVATIAASLEQVMTEHHVRFINASFGSTLSTITASWPRTCGGAIPSDEQLRQVLHVFDPIYALLFHSEGVITAQAATNLGSPADFPFDQVSAQYSNRVRVGFISSLSSASMKRGEAP